MRRNTSGGSGGYNVIPGSSYGADDGSASDAYATHEDKTSGRAHGPLAAAQQAWARAPPDGRRLFLCLAVNCGQFLIQFIIGLASGHLELLADACHLGFGTGVLAVSLGAMAAARLPPSELFPFGLRRAEVLAAFANGCFLLFLAGSFAVEAAHELLMPAADHAHHVLVPTAFLNLLINLWAVGLLRSYAVWRMGPYRSASELNLHACCLHIAADSVRSLGILTTAYLTAQQAPRARVVVAAAVAAALAALAAPMCAAAAGLLVQAAPEGLDDSVLAAALHDLAAGHPGIEGVPEARVWVLTPEELIGTLRVRAAPGADRQALLRYTQAALGPRLGLTSLTVQVDDGGEEGGPPHEQGSAGGHAGGA